MGNHKKTQEGVFIALFALSTLVVLGLAIGFMSNTVNDLLAGQGQVMAGKQSYWLAYSGMEITSTNRFAEITAGTNTYTLEGGEIKTIGTISADKFNGSDRTNEFTSTGTVADGSRQSRWTLENPTNYALVFDGNNDLVSHSMDLATSASASVSTWFMKKGGDGAIQHLVMFNDADDPSGTYGTHLLVGSDNKLFFSIQDYSETQNPSIKSSSTYIVNSLWYHVAATWNKNIIPSAADFKIYVNGVDVTDGGSFSLGGYDTDFALNIDEGTIGADNRTGTPTEFFNGIIDEVSMWSTALSTAQIKSLFIQGRNFSVTNIENGSLAGYWNFQNSFNDASDNSNHGTNTGATFTGI